MNRQEAIVFAKHCAYVGVHRKEVADYRAKVEETLIEEGFSEHKDIADEEYLREVDRLTLKINTK